MKKLLRISPFLVGAVLLISMYAVTASAQQLCSSCPFITMNPICPPVDYSSCVGMTPDQEATCKENKDRAAQQACLDATNEALQNCYMTCVNVTIGGGGPPPPPIPQIPPGVLLPPDPDPGIDCSGFEFLLAAVLIFGVAPKVGKRK